jgi:hypothetical protein
VCTHKNVQEIDRRLLAGESAAQIAQDNALPHRAVLNHETVHLSAKLRRGAAATRVSEAKDLFEELARRYERFGGMELKLEKMLDQITLVCRQFERGKDVARLLAVLREQRETIRELRETGRAALEVLKLLAIARGIDQPPERRGEPQSPEAVAQAARDLFGITEMPELGGEEQKALPAAEDAAPAGGKEPEGEAPAPEPVPAPVVTAQQQYQKTRAEIAGHWEGAHDPQIEEKIRRATPVRNLYQEKLDRIHREGRRAEVGELSPRNLGQQVDLSACEQAAPPANVIGDGQLACPARSCPWSGPGAAYQQHWKMAHKKPVVN